MSSKSPEIGQKLTQTISEFLKSNKTTITGTARAWGVPYGTFQAWLNGSVPKTQRYIKLLEEKIPEFKFEPKPRPTRKVRRSAGQKSSPEVMERIERIRFILILLNHDLNWLARAKREARAKFREQIGSLADLGYLGSFLTAITSEDSLRRFQLFSTLTFTRFGTKNQENSNGQS